MDRQRITAIQQKCNRKEKWNRFAVAERFHLHMMNIRTAKTASVDEKSNRLYSVLDSSGDADCVAPVQRVLERAFDFCVVADRI